MLPEHKYCRGWRLGRGLFSRATRYWGYWRYWAVKAPEYEVKLSTPKVPPPKYCSSIMSY